jgi:FKBP-type peptidyl-prolyl cis-trans isomerase FkpA/FKBP-type peptidyl-prolyl cis-trans isomerase FklB
MSQNLAPFGLSEREIELVKQGFTDGSLNHEKKVDLETYGPKIRELATARQKTMAEAEAKRGADYLVKAAAEPGAVKSESGLIFVSTSEGTGPSPAATDKVKVHYQGTLVDGTVFDSSIKRGEPVTFSLNGVIPCWSEGVQKMKVGGKAKLVCPASIAYGDRGAGALIKPGATLVFEVELLSIEP